MQDARHELRDYLGSRRARTSPQDAGLPVFGRNRRVAGLRREEVALLAGISVEYYTRLERGNAEGASADVLDAVARALRLDAAERAHLYDLVSHLNAARAPKRQPKQERVRPMVQRIIDAFVDHPAYVRNGRLDVLATNALGAAMYAPLFAAPQRPVNVARFIFLDPDAAEFFVDWETMANDSVAVLRAEAGRDPYDRRLSDLVGELSTRSDQFRLRWAAHNVQLSCATVKRLHHPIVGDLALGYEALHLPNDPGQRILVYAAEPGSPTAEALALLASWAARPVGAAAADAHADRRTTTDRPQDRR